MDKVRVAAVQPRSFQGGEEYRNALMAVQYIEESARAGAQLVCFPEGYPGPYSGDLQSEGRLPATPLEMLQEQARKSNLFVVAGAVETCANRSGCFRLAEKLIGPDGAILGNYYRMQPNHPVFNGYLMGGRLDIVPGEEYVLVETPLGVIGLLICSELFVPELSRVLMLRGADIIVAGGGGVHSMIRTRLIDTWQAVARARAAENLLYVVVTQNIFREGARGRTCIAGPEQMVGQRDEPGLVVGDLDMDRLHYLRTHFYDEELLSPPPEESAVYYCRPGQNHDRRPELYTDLTRPQADAFEYKYMEKDTPWRQEYAKIEASPKPGPVRS